MFSTLIRSTAFAVIAFCSACRADSLPLSTVADIPLPGDTSRFDYESYDASRHLLFIAHLGASEVLAFDTKTNTVVAVIPGIGDVHGVLAVPEQGLVYASATKTGEIIVIDETTLKVVDHITGGMYPDGMAYAPAAQKLYVSDETGEAEIVIDTRTRQRVADIALEGEAGNTQYDLVTQHIFVNVQSRGDLVEIDPKTDQVVSRAELPGAKGNHGLLIDATNRLAFIACEDNDKLMMLNLQTRKLAGTFDVGHEPDVLAFDPSLGLLYVASESGSVSLFKLTATGLSKLSEGMMATNAHVVAVAPDTHRAYFPLRNMNGRPILRIVTPALGHS